MWIRRIDKLIIKSFISPFLLTTAVATFILLIQYMLKYFDDFVGKDLGFDVFAELLFYFSLNMMSISLPLGVLVSSLMTFGNLGEHFELTAIKGSGISLLRALRPIFFFVVLLSIGAFYFNNYVVPAANLKAYSLLYDIKHTKPALDIKPGIFYNGIPDYSIKVKEKLPDNQTLKEILIYDHTQKLGNKSVIIADSSKMYTFANDRYLKLELYDGSAYREDKKNASSVDYLYRTHFDHMEIVFDLSSFGLRDTDEELFRNNRQMKNIRQLTDDIDSLSRNMTKATYKQRNEMKEVLKHHLASRVEKAIIPQKYIKEKDSIDNSIEKDSLITQQASMIPIKWLQQLLQADTTKTNQVVRKRKAEIKMKPAFTLTAEDSIEMEQQKFSGIKVDSTKNVVTKDDVRKKAIDSLTWDDINIYYKEPYEKQRIADRALSDARNLKAQLSSTQARITTLQSNWNKFSVEKYKKYSQAFACIVMFLIGAPLGAIIKKGGLGVPVIVSIFFFILYYVLTITSEKWAKAGVTDPMLSVWFADFLLLPVGLFFLRQARADARLFDSDFYMVVIDKVKTRLNKRRQNS